MASNFPSNTVHANGRWLRRTVKAMSLSMITTCVAHQSPRRSVPTCGFCGDSAIPGKIRGLDWTRGFRAGCVVGFAARFEFAAFVAEARHMNQADPLQRKLQGRRQHAKTVLHTAAKVDGRGFFEILRGAGNFSNAEAEVHALSQHLIVEDEVVGVFEQRQVSQYLAAEGAVSGVVFGKLHAEK